MPQELRITWDGASVAQKMTAAVVRGLNILGEHVLNESNDRVPLDEATLQRSGVVSVNEQTLEAAVSYDTVYAVRQHEDLTLHHPNGRRAKYLESAWADSQHLAPQIIGNQIRRALRG
jgi:hypothetical protein